MNEEERRRRRREEHRRTWFELTFDPMPDDVDKAVFELWLAGGTSTRVACEILEVDEAELRRRAMARFSELTDDGIVEIVRAWAAGRIEASAAAELIGADAEALRRLADRLDIHVSRADRRTS